jgi:hypothetical protein
MLTNWQQRKGHTPKKGQEGAQEHWYGRQEAADGAQEAQCSAYPSYRGGQHVQGRWKCHPLCRSQRYSSSFLQLNYTPQIGIFWKLWLTRLPYTVHAAVPSNTFAIYGQGEDKELTELVPGILNQLGPDSLASLRKLAESYQSLQKAEGGEGKADDDDDDIPDLVAGENFEDKVE